MNAITNVVVLMLENRSYDNVLGALSLQTGPAVPSGQKHLNGLTGKESNPGDGTIVVHFTSDPVQIGGTGPAYAPTCLPLIDPGEPFSDMAEQFLGAPQTSNPYTNYPPADTSHLMQGFVNNYATKSSKPSVPKQNVPDIMNYLTPEQLPVMTFLARHFAVCDEWFASVPTQTFANRTFAVLAAPAVEQKLKGLKKEPDGPPYSYIDDKQYAPLPDEKRVASTSIYQRLDESYPEGNDSATAPNWRIYFHDYPINLLADPYAFEKSRSDSNENICLFDSTDYNGHKPLFLKKVPAATFVSDAQGGTLPKFSFIEPRYNMHTNERNGNAGDLLPNCDHPGQGNIPFPVVTAPSAAVNAPIDAASGELLLLQVYNLLRSNEKQWPTTLFIVTFDEPGGTYDHVPPRLATPPGSKFPPAQYPKGDSVADGFNFNVFGGRVPAIIISPQIEEGTTIRATRPLDAVVQAPFDHTSIIATVFNAFGLPPLTDRDAAAPNLIQFCTSSNTTGLFSGKIVCAPSALVFRGTATVMMFASAGAPQLCASMSVQPPWLTAFTPAWNANTNMLTIVVSVDASGVSGLQTATFEVSGDNLACVAVTVTLDPS